MDRFEEAKLKVKEAVDLVQLVEGYIPLTRRGRYLVALCPFHQEKTPSFTVYPDSQHYKCYGCGKTGDVFSYLMEREGLGFKDAMEQLADQAGVSLDGVFGGGDRRADRSKPRLDVHGVLARVRDWFVDCLRGPDGARARAYLDSRGLMAAAERFGLGAHPSVPGRLLGFAKEAGLPVEVLAEAGLSVTRDGGHREPLAGRVVFPIVDERGRVVGFGGRVLPDPSIDPGRDRRPKYLNSPDSPFFQKRRLLFGLRQVKESGVRRIVVVEGYTDVIACHLAGLTGAVATLGTALTAEHARVLERYATEGVVLLFDGDRAGRQAAERAFLELLHTPLAVRIALLPDGSDPADLAGVRPGLDEAAALAGRTRLREIIDGAEDALTTWFRLLRQRLDLTMDANVQRAAAECSRILSEVESVARREALQREMARQLGLSEHALRPTGKGPRRAAAAAAGGDAPGAAAAGAPSPRGPVQEADVDLVACLFADAELCDEVAPDLVRSEELEEVVAWFKEARQRGHATRDAIANHLFTRCGENDGLRGLLADALDRSRRIRDVGSIFSMLVQGRESYFARQEARQTRARLRQALADGDQALADQLTLRYMEQLRKSGAATS